MRRDGQAVPQVLRVRFADGSHRDMPVTTTGSWQRFEFVTRAKAVSAQLDPDDLIPGFTLSFSNVEYEIEEMHSDVAKVHITGATANTFSVSAGSHMLARPMAWGKLVAPRAT